MRSAERVRGECESTAQLEAAGKGVEAEHGGEEGGAFLDEGH